MAKSNLMRKYVILILTIASFTACKNDKKTDETVSKSYDQNDGLITMKGDFIYFADAAVLQTKNEIYGVVVDDKMHELADAVKSYQNEETDMVPVTVRVKRFEKSPEEEGWQYRVEIKEVLKVEAPNPEQKDIIKLGN